MAMAMVCMGLHLVCRCGRRLARRRGDTEMSRVASDLHLVNLLEHAALAYAALDLFSALVAKLLRIFPRLSQSL